MRHQSFLQDLQALEEIQNKKYIRAINKSGALMLNRKLPPQIASRLPEDMIPKPVLRLFTKWQSGELQLHKEVNVPRYHDQLKNLRRYKLARATVTPIQ